MPQKGIEDGSLYFGTSLSRCDRISITGYKFAQGDLLECLSILRQTMPVGL